MPLSLNKHATEMAEWARPDYYEWFVRVDGFGGRRCAWVPPPFTDCLKVQYSYAREAVADYRRARNITTDIRFLPNTYDPMAYWFRCRKGSSKQPETCSGQS